jgi:hypothetical protein
VRAPAGADVTIRDASGRRDADVPGFHRDADGSVGVSRAADGPYTVLVEDGSTVEVAATGSGGTARVWREVGLGPDGGSVTVDVAAIFGPASLVVGTATPAASTTQADFATVVLVAAAATVVIALLVVRLRLIRAQ